LAEFLQLRLLITQQNEIPRQWCFLPKVALIGTVGCHKRCGLMIDELGRSMARPREFM
jgi:hypothetical protein